MRKFHGFTPLETDSWLSDRQKRFRQRMTIYKPAWSADKSVFDEKTVDRMFLRYPSARSLTGFTFVELLIVAALSALVLLALYSGFKSGVLVWRRAQQTNIKQEEIILFTEKLSSELSNSFVFTGIGFKGEAFEVSFPALLVSTTQEETPVLIRKPGRVIYNWAEENKSVRRLQYDYSQIYQDQEDVPARELVIGITGLIFTYYKYDAEAEDYIWSEEWLENDQPPKAVKVEIKFKDTNDNEKTITRIIPIPNG